MKFFIFGNIISYLNIVTCLEFLLVALPLLDFCPKHYHKIPLKEQNRKINMLNLINRKEKRIRGKKRLENRTQYIILILFLFCIKRKIWLLSIIPRMLAIEWNQSTRQWNNDICRVITMFPFTQESWVCWHRWNCGGNKEFALKCFQEVLEHACGSKAVVFSLWLHLSMQARCALLHWK